jgi:hypothetical protein
MGNITIQGDLTGDVPGGEVGGASNLTTAGAIPYVSAPGTLNQDATALFWDAANDRLGVGVSAPTTTLDVGGNSRIRGSLDLQTGPFSSSLNMWSGAAVNVRLSSDPGLVTYFAAGNVVVGGVTNNNFKLDVATSGSAGTARFYDQASPLGLTKVVVRAGAGEAFGNWLLEVQAKNGTRVGGIQYLSDSAIQVSGLGFFTTTFGVPIGSAPNFGSGGFQFSSTASAGSGLYDLSLSRASAGVLQVGDGGSNANGQVSATRVLHAGVLVAALPAAAAGNAGSIQYVTDANATTIGSTVAGGGANKVMVWSDGAAWKIFAS